MAATCELYGIIGKVEKRSSPAIGKGDCNMRLKSNGCFSEAPTSVNLLVEFFRTAGIVEKSSAVATDYALGIIHQCLLYEKNSYTDWITSGLNHIFEPVPETPS